MSLKLLWNIPIKFKRYNKKIQLMCMCPFSLCSKSLFNTVVSTVGLLTNDLVILMFYSLIYFCCVEGTDQDKYTVQLMLLKGRITDDSYIHIFKDNFHGRNNQFRFKLTINYHWSSNKAHCSNCIREIKEKILRTV